MKLSHWTEVDSYFNDLLVASDPALVNLVFIDAGKPGNPNYFAWALKLTRPRSAIAADNVVRNGEVVDAYRSDPGAQGIRRVIEFIAFDPLVTATAIRTAGSKGYDGFAIALAIH